MRSEFPLDLVVQTPGHLPGIVWGPPAVGKTAHINNLFKWLKAPLVTVIGAVREPGDVGGGFPMPTENGMKLIAPAWLHEINAAAQDKPLAGVFFSEMTCSPPAIQAAILRVIHEGVVGEERLLPQVVRVCDANPPDQAAAGWELALPLAMRLTHLQWPEPQTLEWIDGFMGDWAEQSFTHVDTARWHEEYPRAKAMIAGFLRKFTTYLREDPAKDASRFPQAYAAPRTIENAARLLATVLVTGRDDAKLTLMAASCGRPWALKFTTWIEEAGLPDPEDLLRNPTNWTPDSTRPDVTYAVLMGVASAALRAVPDKESRWLAAWLVLNRALSAGKGVIAVAAQMLCDKARCPKVSKIPADVAHIVKEVAVITRAAGLYDSLR